ncbi:hypothetical protein [Desulfovibrio ferrophilus]|uniref:Doubled CXXCH motif domain-containing protein n=1 Tax=Desulfovibrio ferrophilus TaxID=241368 RepID=A0A2Z6AVD1_9BACT|nr:hypothetical protein [Desulfovibrio ferrophilus]BBD07191.1 uncharacterized protein DFE_0465 [Desulfovibrio ferrophilus]
MRAGWVWLGAMALCALATVAWAGPYTDSAHGDAGFGVLRSSVTQYTRGHCGHCHEQHASIAGSEPSPSGGPDAYLLYETNHVSQTENFCFTCHTGAGGNQVGGISINRSYTYNFGGDTTPGSYDSDIAAAFSHTMSGSSHHLDSIVSQVLGKTMYDADNIPWSLPADINPCDACHNPHLVKRNYPVDISGGLLGTAVTRPSDPDNLWGDDSSERASAVGWYQAPYWFGRTDRYEPDNDTVQDGSNLPDYNRLCTDCHNDYNTIYSENPMLPDGPRNLRKINWTATSGAVTADAHGVVAGSPRKLQMPYSAVGGNIILGCLDCHEPHGTPYNIYLLRSSVNGKAVHVTDETDTAWLSFCQNSCHGRKHDWKVGCAGCHYHGAARGGF